MFQRHKPVIVVTGIMFAIYVLAQLSTWVTKHHNHVPDAVSYAALAGIAITMFVVAFRWSIRWPSAQMLPRALLALVFAAVLSAVLGPLAAGGYPFKTGAGAFFNVIWLFLGIGLIAGVLGLVFAMALGKDYRTVALRNYEAAKAGKPRRV